MKRQIAVIVITLSLAAFSWAKGTNEFFDGKKCQTELQIMKGILNTTISFIEESQDQQGLSIWRNPSIQAFYLADQGAVFVIPVSSYPSYNLELSRALDATRESLNELRNNLRFEILEDGSLVAPAPPLPPAPPAPFEFPIVDQEKLKAQIEKQTALIAEYTERAEMYREEAEMYREEAERQREEAEKQFEEGELQREEAEKQREEAEKQREWAEKQREKAKQQMEEAAQQYREMAEKRREEDQKRREKLLQRFEDIKAHLVEALANYGDSLTTVKPDEYINLVLNIEDFGGGTKKQFHTISAQKSWITDYKAGRLSLEDLRQKARQYTQ